MRIVLDVIEGPAKGRQFSFDRPDCFLLGRSSDAHISLPDDKHLSRRHFLLEIAPPDCKLSDLDSKNGVFVNGVRYGGRKAPKPGVKQAPEGVKQVRLKHGDVITVGDTRLKLSIFSEQIHLEPQADMTHLPSNTQAEDYRIEQEIGRGPLGIVYKAFDIRTGRPAAVKVMTPRHAVEPAKIKRLQRKLAVVSQLQHPGLVRFLKHWVADENFYFAFEYVDGMNLAEFLKQQGGRLDLKEAVPLMLAILEGLAFAHQVVITFNAPRGKVTRFRGIVHSQLKPQNILLSCRRNRWIPKIAGFGFSQGLEAAGFTNMSSAEGFGAAPLYWPRERVSHYRISHPVSDVFSIAAVFYELLSGFHIRDGFQSLLTRSERGEKPPLSDYLRTIVTQAPVPLQQRNPRVPDALARVIDKALEENSIPQDRRKAAEILHGLRYPDAVVFREALLSACRQSGIETVPDDAQQASAGWNTGTIVGNAEQQAQEAGGTIVYSAVKSSGDRPVALLLLDVVQSTQFVVDAGDTSFSSLIGQLHRRIRGHSSASELSFLKCTGDGFLAVYQQMPAAFGLAKAFLDEPLHQDVKVRIALHWGMVKRGPGGDVLGKEVHRVCRIEGVQVQDRLETPEETPDLPPDDRILITREARAQLPLTEQQQLSPVGSFRLKGFREACLLWGLWE